ncbi:uncharacterized protein [Macrobrachium rosenbergii]|uniref:uncharacterized protein n=1 Tax=Macrobrachium rosenbergii TaxID=79674 RepID=UPI0034D47F4B
MRLNVHFSYNNVNSDDNNDAFGVYHEEFNLRAFLSSRLATEDMANDAWKIFPETWNHLCHVIGNSSYVIYWQGKKFFEGPLSPSWSLNMNGSLVLGQEQDTIGGGFDPSQVMVGDIAQLIFWDSMLTSGQVHELATCNSIDKLEFFHSDHAQFENSGAQEEWQNISTLCRKSDKYFVILPEQRSFQRTVETCKLLNLSIAVPMDAEENNALTQGLVDFQDAITSGRGAKLWLGLKNEREGNIWRDVSTNEVPSYLNFALPFSSGGDSFDCAVLTTKGRYSDESCAELSKNYGACQAHRYNFFRLRGLCFEHELESRFRIDGYHNNRPVFLGYYDLAIVWDINSISWKLVSAIKQITYLEMVTVSAKQYPVGQNTWIVENEICGKAKGQALELSLSSCLEDTFMCKTGHCISQEFRCNLRTECDDGSGEQGCNRILIDDLYQKNVPPTGPGGGSLKLSSRIQLFHITNVDDMNMAITLEFRVNLTWVDPRVNLKHLGKTARGTTLTSEEVDSIWRPTYQLLNLENGRKELLESHLTILTANNATEADFNDLAMELTYPGSENAFTTTDHYTARFVCGFGLFGYPFDVQKCSVGIQLAAGYGGYVVFSPEEDSFQYSGPRDLSLYSVTDVSGRILDDNSRMELVFKLHRRPGYILLTAFVPSTLLLLVSWATLFIQLEQVTARATTALTSLLVLYTLFSNTSRSLPVTAGIKLFDFWFFFIKFMLFVNILFHIFVRDEVSLAVEPVSRIMAFSRTRFIVRDQLSVVKVFGPFQHHVPLRVLRLYRSMIIPIILTLFNLTFWIAVGVVRYYLATH